MKLALGLILFAPAFAATPDALKWIAHRGGVVDARYSENSPASLEAAIQHGYWMIESDIRETRDGRLITHHDPDFKRFYNDPRKVSDLTLAEIRKLRAEPGGTPPMTFTELVNACKGRLRLMMDVKEPAHGKAFYQEMERELKRTGLLESTYFIGTEESRQYFKGKARIGVTFVQLQQAIARGEKTGTPYFLFEWGKTLTPEQVRFAQQHGVPVVPSINTFHYANAGQEPIGHGAADIQRLRPLGVTEFQIDSVYEPAFE
ncbi:MAG: glycerophosphodiester phosphodiesterase [Bryobacteraceae bacterium]